jgi:hypothetical protein
MDNLGPILLIVFVTVVVPVAIARYGVRAEWRTVLWTCLVWYGLIICLTGTSQDGLGWALLIAPIFSIPAIPIIAFALKTWTWLGRANAGVTIVAAKLPGMRQFPLSLLSPAQWMAAALLVAGWWLGSTWLEQRDLNARADVLRPFFNLPEGAKFSGFQSFNSPLAAPRIAVKMRFSEREFKSFATQIDQGSAWKNGVPDYDGAPLEAPSVETIRWRDLPMPVRAGTEFVSWSNLSGAEIESVRRGRVLCIALQRKPGVFRVEKMKGVPRYLAKDCSDIPETDRVSILALGTLDFETRTLHMMIK